MGEVLFSFNMNVVDRQQEAECNEDVQRRAMQGLAQSLTAEPGKVVPMVKTGS